MDIRRIFGIIFILMLNNETHEGYKRSALFSFFIYGEGEGGVEVGDERARMKKKEVNFWYYKNVKRTWNIIVCLGTTASVTFTMMKNVTVASISSLFSKLFLLPSLSFADTLFSFFFFFFFFFFNDSKLPLISKCVLLQSSSLQKGKFLRE